MNVICIGAGYVGCVTAASLAACGHRTTIIDIDPVKINAISRGISPIYEPGLDDLISAESGKNLFADSSFAAISEADLVMICVGTPSRPDGSADLRAVELVAEHIAARLNPDRFSAIVLKSTVPVGTTERISGLLERLSGFAAGERFAVVSNPEFLREGFALRDFFYPDRIIIGAANPRERNLLIELYRSVMDRARYGSIRKIIGDPPDEEPHTKTVFFGTDPKSAELIKYVSNAFLAVKISYINEVARLCDSLGANVEDVAKGMGLDTRIGDRFLQVSSGWSGSCFPKDTKELLSMSQRFDQELSVVKAAIESNDRMHRYCLNKLRTRLASLQGRTVGILGLTFKPDTDDARQTQALYFIRELIQSGANVRAHDPKGMSMFRRLNPDLPISYCEQPEDVAEQADAILLLTHWSSYRNLNWRAMRERARGSYFLDTRNDLSKTDLREAGFRYEGIGVRE